MDLYNIILQAQNTNEIHTLFFKAEINSTITKHRFQNAVNVTVKHTAFFVYKNKLSSTLAKEAKEVTCISASDVVNG